jgi:hypothetical protein
MTDDAEDVSGVDDCPYGYVFLVGYSPRGVHVDRYLDVSAAILNKTPEAFDDWARAAKAVSQGGLPIDSANQLAAAVSTMRMRARVTDCYGPYFVRSPELLEPEDMQRVLIAHEKRGTLETFLRAARF